MWVMAVSGAAPCQCFSHRLEPDDVAGVDVLDRPAQTLDAAEAGGDDQHLPQGMGVPGGTSARLEGDGVAGRPGRRDDRIERIDADGAGEPVGRAFHRRTRAGAGDLHGCFLSGVADAEAFATVKIGRRRQLDDQVGEAGERNVVTAERLVPLRQAVADGRIAGEPAGPQNRVVEVGRPRSAAPRRDRGRARCDSARRAPRRRCPSS